VIEPHKQVSDVPLIAAGPTRRGNNLLLLFILGCLVAVVTGLTLYWLDLSKPEPDTHVTQWPREIPLDPERRSQGDYDAAIAHMQQLAAALLQYRDGPNGGGVRWPDDFRVLQDAGVLEAGWDFNGVLSGQPIIYQPEMPIGHDPERWVMCHDVEMARYRTNSGYTTRGPRAAVVILADGTVKLIEGDDLETYGGLNLAVSAGR
jgi:hypothetical protein